MKKINVFAFLTGAVCCLGVPVMAQHALTGLNEYFNEVEQLRQFNGTILLGYQHQLVYLRSMGYADMATRKKIRQDAHFNLASISKLFTATAVLQLKEKGRLSTEDAVVKWLPEFPWPAVTIRHLLTHTSGLADLELFEHLVKQYPDTIVGNKNIIPELRRWQRGLYFTPGDEFRYCNTEYSLLAMVVEKVAGVSFPDYLQKHIFKVAGMKEAYVAADGVNSFRKDPAMVSMQLKKHPFYDSAYITVDSVRQYRYLHYNCSAFMGQSNLISTVHDVFLFDKAFFGGKLLKRATMEEAFTPLKLNHGQLYVNKRMDTMEGEGVMYMGLGWEIFDQPRYGRSVGHGGFKFGLATFYFHQLAKDQVVVVFDNAPNSEFGRIITSSQALLNGDKPWALRTKRSVAGLYGAELVKHGIDAAIVLFNTHKHDTARFYLSEWEMNELGYDLFYKSSFNGHQTLALEVFKVATLVFPDSFNTYDSYAQLLKDSGHKEAAILMYKKSIALNPDNEDGKRILKMLTEEEAAPKAVQ